MRIENARIARVSRGHNKSSDTRDYDNELFNKAVPIDEYHFRVSNATLIRIESDVKTLLSSLRKSRHTPDQNTNTICTYIKDLAESGVNPGFYFSKQILQVLIRNNFLTEARQLLNKHLKLLFNLDDENTAQSSLRIAIERKAGNPEKCEKILRELQANYLPVTSLHYREVIAAFAKVRMESKAFALFKEMRELGISPDYVSCLQLLYSCNSIKKALRVVKIMESLNFESRSLNIYITLTHIAIRNGQLHLPLQFISAAVADGHVLNTFALEAVCKYYVVSGQPLKAILMFPSFSTPSVAAYILLERACHYLTVKEGDLYHQVLMELKSTKKTVSYNNNSYTQSDNSLQSELVDFVV